MVRCFSLFIAFFFSYAAPSVASILVVDDEPGVRHACGLILERAGHEVVLAADGREGWALVQDHEGRRSPFTLVLTDTEMPNMDGPALVTQLKGYPWIKYLVMSGRPMETVIQLYAQIPVPPSQIISKPLDRHLLLKRVQEKLQDP